MNKLLLTEAEFIAHKLAETLFTEFEEPMPDFKTRYPGKLESCLEQPFQTFGGKDLYGAKVIDKAAILFYLIIKNHPFENGNKRMAVALTLVFLFKNKYWLNISTTDLYELAMTVAQSSPKDKDKTTSNLQYTFNKYVYKHNTPVWFR